MATANPLPHEVLVDDLDVAPLDWNDFTPEQRADIKQSLADVTAGRAKLVPHAEVQRVIAEMRRQQGG
jgi:hypothetical protein